MEFGSAKCMINAVVGTMRDLSGDRPDGPGPLNLLGARDWPVKYLCSGRRIHFKGNTHP